MTNETEDEASIESAMHDYAAKHFDEVCDELEAVKRERDALKDILSRKAEDVLASGFRAGADKLHAQADDLRRQLAEALAREAALRDVLTKWRSLPRDPRWGHAEGFRMLQEYEQAADRALASKPNDAALREFGQRLIAAVADCDYQHEADAVLERFLKGGT